MKALFLILASFILVYCSTSKSSNTQPKEIDYCQKIDSLIYERYNLKSGNFISNKIIPIIESKTKIEASCQKGYYGYLYTNDSLFDSDVKKWKEYFKCK